MKNFYKPAGDQHPFWLRCLFIIVWVSVMYICCAVSFAYFENHAAYFGIPIGFVGGYYIAYYGMYGLYKTFSDVSKDLLYKELEKLKEQKDIDKKNNKD